MQSAGVLVVIALAASACGPSVEALNFPDAGAPAECFDPGLDRCDDYDGAWQECIDGVWTDVMACEYPTYCLNNYGCVECNPSGSGRVCVGDEVFTCTASGTLGDYIETCPEERCNGGTCDPGCAGPSVKLIYLVDQDENLLSFDPGAGNTLELIGVLDCPAGEAYPDWGFGEGRPYSMSIDRDARAWVLYTSGQMFLVSTEDASCGPTAWAPGTNGYQLFGMGFVSDAPDAETEKLYIAGGYADDVSGGNLGFIDPTTMAVTTAGPLPSAEYSAELTGTGNGELYGYYPGSLSTYVARIDSSTGANVHTWPLPSLEGWVDAWAFAHWGGLFYVFITWTDDIESEQHREVYRLDPEAGEVILLIPDTGYVIVGAGVSTCAPVVIP